MNALCHAMPWAMQKLNVSERELVELLVELILDGRVAGKMDQVTGTLQLQHG